MRKKGVLGKKRQTRDELQRNISQAVLHLESHLDHPLAMGDLAEKACMSRYHFQRVFREVVGESVARYLRRLRLEKGASLLRHSDWKVLDIALACGYSSPSNYSRDFSRHFGQTPRQFRANRETVPFLRGFYRADPSPRPVETMQYPVQATVEAWPAMQAVCLRFYGPVRGIARPWRQLVSWAEEALPAPAEARFFGLWLDEWSKNDERYRYECAIVPTSPCPNPPAPFHLRGLPGGKVAVATAHGCPDELDRAWRTFATGWLPYSGWLPRGDIPGIDSLPADLMLSSPTRQALTLISGVTIRMCLPVQRGPVSV